MDQREHLYINNYSFYGESCRRRYKYNLEDAQAIKDKYKKEGVYLLPVKKMVEKRLPKKGTKQKDNSFGAVQFAVASLSPSDQEQIIELAKNIPDPRIMMDQAIAIQQYRVKIGLQNEYEQGRLLDTTESAMGNLAAMIQTKFNMEEGQDVNLNVNSSITALLDEIDEEESDDITIDVDKENKKEQLKQIHLESINDYLDE